jgi:SAM-dependent methyltransferase
VSVAARSVCPLCGSSDLVEYADRPAARCSECGALERHRKLARLYGELFEQGAGRRALEIGPLNPRVFGQYLRERGWTYTSIDQSRRGNPHDPRDTGFVDLEADARDLSFLDDGSTHLILAQHVIEEILDYRSALAEIARVLAEDGTALLEIPFDPARPRSESHSPKAFGNVWSFGSELPDVAREHFGEVDVLSYKEGRHHGQQLICRAGSPA